MTIKRVFRWSRRERVFRLFRVIWTRGTVGDGVGYGAKFTVALRPAIFGFRCDWDGWRATVLGIRLHYQRAYGGVPA